MVGSSVDTTAPPIDLSDDTPEWALTSFLV